MRFDKQVAVTVAKAAEWAVGNPLLKNGSIGLETDTHRFKIGDGIHKWNELEYESSGSGSGGGNVIVDMPTESEPYEYDGETIYVFKFPISYNDVLRATENGQMVYVKYAIENKGVIGPTFLPITWMGVFEGAETMYGVEFASALVPDVMIEAMAIGDPDSPLMIPDDAFDPDDPDDPDNPDNPT